MAVESYAAVVMESSAASTGAPTDPSRMLEHTCADQAIPASVLVAIEPVTGGIL